jgi:small subunit ribosomal protein S6
LKKYECLYIVNMNYDSEGVSAVTARVETVLKNVGAELANSQHWGKRKLAYAIDKERYGNYILLHFQGEDPNVTELHREFEIESGVLHYMTIRLDEFPDFETLSVPQAYETDRKRPYSQGPRKPYRSDGDSRTETPAPAAPVASVETSAPKEEAVVEETAAPAEVVEETAAAVKEEVVETAAPAEVVEETAAVVEEEVVETVAPTEVVEEEAVESVEESAETADEEAEKPADSE